MRLKNLDLKIVTITITRKNSGFIGDSEDMNSQRCSNPEDSQDLYGEVRVIIEFDQNNHIDQEIQKHIQKLKVSSRYRHEEILYRRILHKRLASNQYSRCINKNKRRIDEAIEISIKRRIERTGISREYVIREAFCLQFDIPFFVSED